MKIMPQPIKVRGRFATAHDTAETLGVSPSRTQELIEVVRKSTQGAVNHKTDGFVARRKMRTRSPANAATMKKNSGRHAEASRKRAATRVAKAHR